MSNVRFGVWAVIGLTVTVLALSGIGWLNYAVWGSRYENTRHAIFKESQAYQDGAVKNLARFKLEYEMADDAHKPAIRSIILTEASVVDVSQLPTDLQSFLGRLKATTN